MQDGPDIRQGGRNEDSPDGRVDKVQKILNTVSGSDQDVYVTMHGRVLRRNGKLKSCRVTDGCAIQVTSRMPGGGRHKDEKSKEEKKQVMKQEPVSNKGQAKLRARMMQ